MSFDVTGMLIPYLVSMFRDGCKRNISTIINIIIGLHVVSCVTKIGLLDDKSSLWIILNKIVGRCKWKQHDTSSEVLFHL